MDVYPLIIAFLLAIAYSGADTIDSGRTRGIFHRSANVTPYFMVEDSLWEKALVVEHESQFLTLEFPVLRLDDPNHCLWHEVIIHYGNAK